MASTSRCSVGVPEALLGDERIAVRRIALARGMVNLGDLMPTFRRHV